MTRRPMSVRRARAIIETATLEKPPDEADCVVCLDLEDQTCPICGE